MNHNINYDQLIKIFGEKQVAINKERYKIIEVIKVLNNLINDKKLLNEKISELIQCENELNKMDQQKEKVFKDLQTSFAKFTVPTEEAPSSVNEPTPKVLTPEEQYPDANINTLYFACKKGKVEKVKVLLKHSKVNPNKDDNKFNVYTPLEIACKKGHIEIIKLLLEDGRSKPSNDGYWCYKNAKNEEVKKLLVTHPDVKKQFG